MPNYHINTEQDQEAFYQLYLYAFNKPDSQQRRAFFNERFDHATNYGLQHNGQLTSALYSLPFTVNFAGTEYSMRGIGDVCSAPEYSGQGGAGTLLKAALHDMFASGTTLSYLAPFAFTYYRRFGYEQVFNHMNYTIKTNALPQFPHSLAPGTITRGPLENNLATIKPRHRTQIAKTGGLLRPDWWWNYLTIKNNWDIAIYYDASGQATGYLIYERTATTLNIIELIAPTAEAFTALRQFILKHGNSFTQINYSAPNLTYTGDLFPDPTALATTVTPYMMARIVNLQDFITHYPGKRAVTSLRMAISDPILPANNGTWLLKQSAFAKVSSTLAPTADLTTTIQNLTKILFGAQRIDSLIRQSDVIATPAAAQIITDLVGQNQPTLIDYF